MQPDNLISRLFRVLYWRDRPAVMTIHTRGDNGKWVKTEVPNGSSFTYFNERFGGGNWKL